MLIEFPKTVAASVSSSFGELDMTIEETRLIILRAVESVTASVSVDRTSNSVSAFTAVIEWREDSRAVTALVT